MPSNDVAETVAAVAATVAAVGITVGVIALACSGDLPDITVDKPTVVVHTPTTPPTPPAPIPGVPAYKVPMGQPCVVQYHNPTVAVRLPKVYQTKYKYVVYNNTHCPIVWRNNIWCYQYGNRYYPVVYY